ncbi:hypothetical protein [Rhizobium leguminosarum]|uniref:hypothetical protein n=1 Tax=Rhizobium leguminosarum TaxID=384 RepID=UPI0039658C66
MIATDKTGALTSNVQTVTEIRLPDGTDIALDAHADLDRCEIRASGLDGERARRLLRALLANESSSAGTTAIVHPVLLDEDQRRQRMCRYPFDIQQER